jgi:uncharacterized glyoxalase superfamily metalloenzyme YdcJ
VHFPDSDGGDAGTHTARFGEIEQRGLALTPKGRALYDQLSQARDAGGEGSTGGDYGQRLQAVFASFPDDHDTLRQEGLGYYRYQLTDAGRAAPERVADLPAEALVAAGLATADPIVYEDFRRSAPRASSSRTWAAKNSAPMPRTPTARPSSRRWAWR